MRLTLKIVSYVFILLFITFSIFSYLSITKEKKELNSLLEEHGKSLAITIANFSIESLIVEDYNVIQTHVNALAERNKNIVSIEIFHNNLNVVKFARECDNTIEFYADIQEKSIGKIGSVKIKLSNKKNQAFIKQKIYQTALFMIVLSVLLFVLIVWLIETIILKKISELVKYSEVISKFNYKQSIRIYRCWVLHI